MCGDAAAEGASLVLLDQPGQVHDLVGLTAAAGQVQQASPQIQAELQMWAARPAARPGTVSRATPRPPWIRRTWPGRPGHRIRGRKSLRMSGCRSVTSVYPARCQAAARCPQRRLC